MVDINAKTLAASQQILIDWREFGDAIRLLAECDEPIDPEDGWMCVLCYASTGKWDDEKGKVVEQPHDRLCPWLLAHELKEAGRLPELQTRYDAPPR